VSASDPRPFVVTAELDEQSFAWLDGLRRAHFPPERNHLAAHLTLFHALPGALHDQVGAELLAVSTTAVTIDGVAARWMLLGRGVAMALEAPALVALRAQLAHRLAGVLTRQDAGGFRPHVTVQNKVTPEEVRALKARLDASHTPRAVRIPALRLWRYDGGPWEFVQRFPLGASSIGSG
jgi:hypothetical protein